KPFDTQRVQIQDIKTGQIILIDLTAKKQASAETIRVEFEADQTPAAMAGKAASGQPARRPIPPAAFKQSGTGAPTPVRLVRHAAQALYAPQRLVDGAPGIHRIAVSIKDSISGL